MLKTLYLVRHGESEWNARRRIQGQLDSRLSEAGKRQAQALAARLDQERFDAVVASDLSRAVETAVLCSGRSADGIRLSADLREVCFGDWEGLSPEEVKERYPGDWENFRRDPVHCRPASGESYRVFASRISTALRQLHSDYAGRGVLAVTHGGPIRMALILILGIPPGHWRTLRVANTGLTKVEFRSDGPRLCYYDTTNHLCPSYKLRTHNEEDEG